MPLFHFGKKKKKEEMPTFSDKLPSLSSTKKPDLDLPDFPGKEREKVPMYESDLGSIKKAVEKPTEFKPMPGIPQREKLSSKKPKIISEHNERVAFKEPVHHVDSTKPIFVKIEDYKSAIRAIDSIKDRLDDASAALDQIEKIKDQEEREIGVWRDNIEKLKDKLLFIDEKLFEV